MAELLLKRNALRILPLHSVRLEAENAAEAEKRLARLLEAGDPDLILLNGDIFRAPVSQGEAESLLSAFLRSARESGIPFAFTFGEGDRRCGLKDEELKSVFLSSPGCLPAELTEETDGSCDGVIPIRRASGDAPVLILRLFDTHRETTDYERDYGSPGRSRLPYPLYTPHYMDGVRFNQTAWFDRDADRLEARYGKPVPELFFFHTPTPEHAQLPLNQDRLRVDGTIREARKCQTVNGGIGMAAAESRRVLGIVSGHEETNDYFGTWAGMILGVEPSFPHGAWIAEVMFPKVPVLRIRRI